MMGTLSGIFYLQYFCNFSIKRKLFQSKKAGGGPAPYRWLLNPSVAGATARVAALFWWRRCSFSALRMSRKPLPVHALLFKTTQPVYTRRSQFQAFLEVRGRALEICGHHTNPQFIPFVIVTPFWLAELHPCAHLVHVKEQAGSGNEAHDGNVTPRTGAGNGAPGSRPRGTQGPADERSVTP